MARLMGSSPLTRGKRASNRRKRREIRLIPAHAGKTTWCSRLALGSRAHPRSRGENRLDVGQRPVDAGSSPLTRGKPCPWISVQVRGGLIPAHAGKTSIAALSFLTRAAHPRSRGENAKLHSPNTRALGSSPLTRGKHPGQSPTSPGYGLIPAHAGKTRRVHEGRPQPWAHPRSRGENRLPFPP